ncbi:MAG: UxaA family hydrolase [Atopobiaceae bacterium]|nr:UxaA family hydrolase [Atopobiaceae bacterium]
MADRPIALQAKPNDNVATIFADDITAGTEVVVLNAAGEERQMAVREAIPYGHKFALCDIAAGEQITKYGEEIGVASRDISTGAYVHVHNLDSMRGRGDLERGE